MRHTPDRSGSLEFPLNRDLPLIAHGIIEQPGLLTATGDSFLKQSKSIRNGIIVSRLLPFLQIEMLVDKSRLAPGVVGNLLNDLEIED